MQADTSLILESERNPEGGHGTHILAWRISWTEEPGGLQSTGHKESDTTEVTKHSCTYTHVLREREREIE